MNIYIIWAIAGFILLFVELVTPTMFFLNLAAGAFFAGIVAYFFPSQYWLHIFVFAVVSSMCLLFLRPLMVKKQGKGQNYEAMYIGKEAKVVQAIKGLEGKIKIYDEVWNAKSVNGEEIEENTLVKIIDSKDLTMYVEKL